MSASPWPIHLPTVSKTSMAALSPSRAAWVTCRPVIPPGSPPASFRSLAPWTGETVANSRASCTSAEPEP